jgi:hypothetical protein
MKNIDSLEALDIDSTKSIVNNKSSLHFFIKIVFLLIFLSVSFFSIFYIATDKQTIDENSASQPVVKDVFLPHFVPNSVKYQSTEPIRVYKKPLTEKDIIYEAEVQKKIDKIDYTSLYKLNSDSKEKISTSTNQVALDTSTKSKSSFLKLTKRCYTVNKPEIFQIESSGFSSEDGNLFSYWTGKNITDKTIAISFTKNGKKIAVSFIPPQSEISTKLPASNIRFGVMQSDSKCIVWGTGSEIISFMPSISSNGIHNQYANAVFESLFFVNNNKYELKTNLLGIADN